MPDLKDGETHQMIGSTGLIYQLRNTGGVYSCNCPSWRNQSVAIDVRTCKHLKRFRGEAAEFKRIGKPMPKPRVKKGQKVEPPPPPPAKPVPPPLLLAESWDGVMDPKDWWVSEKLDGVRAMWDGSKFISRLGNEFLAPDWLKQKMPPFSLDGELWTGRGRFQRTVSVVRRQDKGEGWEEVKYLVFDILDEQAKNEVFESRQQRMAELLSGYDSKHIEVVQQIKCEGFDHMCEMLKEVEGKKGEGLMLRQVGSLYEPCRSKTLLKVKTFIDAEAKVIGHQAGRGKHKGRLGAVEVETPNGVKFKLGTGFTDYERENPPPVGSTVTYRYQELSITGVPRFPAYIGRKVDVEGN